MPVTLKNGLTSSEITFFNQGNYDPNDQSCPAGIEAMVSYSIEGGSSGEVNVMCPEDFEPGMPYEPGMPGFGTSVDINWG